MTAQKTFPSMNEPVSAIPSPWTIQMAPMIMAPTAKELGNTLGSKVTLCCCSIAQHTAPAGAAHGAQNLTLR
jgi:hypothetical protein